MVLADRKLKLREIADTLRILEGSVCTILHENISTRKLCSKWVPRFLQSIKNNNASTIQSAVWSCFSAIRRIFSCDM